MSTDQADEVTRLLDACAAGNDAAKDDLIACVYQQLHSMAHRLMAAERQGHSWGTTDLVHEAYLQLFRTTAPTKSRAYFFGAAARAMRRLLVAHARSRKMYDFKRTPLDDVLEDLEKTQKVSLEELEKALKDLESLDKRSHEIVMLRTFGGLKMGEIADQLDVALSTVEKDWKWARTWLYTRLREDDHGN